MEKQKLKTLIKKTYEEIFKSWYTNIKIIPANINIEISKNVHDSGFSLKSNEIRISMDEQILEESNDLDGIQWPRWYSELVHEMIHEYQLKVKPEMTMEGEKIYNLYQSTPNLAKSNNGLLGFDGNGHDKIFYTTICIHAPYFNLIPNELKKRI